MMIAVGMICLVVGAISFFIGVAWCVLNYREGRFDICSTSCVVVGVALLWGGMMFGKFDDPQTKG